VLRLTVATLLTLALPCNTGLCLLPTAPVAGFRNGKRERRSADLGTTLMPRGKFGPRLQPNSLAAFAVQPHGQEHDRSPHLDCVFRTPGEEVTLAAELISVFRCTARPTSPIPSQPTNLSASLDADPRPVLAETPLVLSSFARLLVELCPLCPLSRPPFSNHHFPLAARPGWSGCLPSGLGRRSKGDSSRSVP